MGCELKTFSANQPASDAEAAVVLADVALKM
jgi:hypothetical protein